MIFMNVKYSRSMNKKTVLISVLLLAATTLSRSQDYDWLMDSQLWSGSSNINWIRTLDEGASSAELSQTRTAGDFHSPHDASSLWRTLAQAKGVKRFDSTSLLGEFSFTHTSMGEAGGSMSTVPEYYPVDIYEFTPGTKIKQTYAMKGGISREINENWHIGGSFSYQSQNYAKFNNLRHTTYYMSLEASPAVVYNHGSWSIGGVYTFYRNTQSIVAEELGTSTGVYYAFLDKGVFYGVNDIWDNSSVHLKDTGVDRFPIQENGHKISLQGKTDALYAEITAGLNSGKIGEKQRVWYDYNSSTLDATLGYLLNSERAKDIFRVSFALFSQQNFENILEEITENGITTTYNFGQLQIRDRERLSLSASWLHFSKATGSIFSAGLSYGKEDDTLSLLYPYMNTSSLQSIDFGVKTALPVGKRLLLGGQVRLQKGFWDEDSRKVSSIQGSTEPLRCLTLYEDMYKWKTDWKFPVSAFVRYNFLKNLYAKGELAYIIHKEGQKTATISLIYNF